MSSLHGTDKAPQGQEISHSVQMTLERLAPLLGLWQGRGRGEYPTIADFYYAETFRFRSGVGAAYLTYEQSTEIIDAQGNPIRKSHWEAGVLRPQDDGSIELACVQSGGRVEVLRGNMLVEETHPAKLSLRFQSVLVGNDERVKSTNREWYLDGERFKYVMKMAAVGVDELLLHVEASLYQL